MLDGVMLEMHLCDAKINPWISAIYIYFDWEVKIASVWKYYNRKTYI